MENRIYNFIFSLCLLYILDGLKEDQVPSDGFLKFTMDLAKRAEIEAAQLSDIEWYLNSTVKATIN